MFLGITLMVIAYYLYKHGESHPELPSETSLIFFIGSAVLGILGIGMVVNGVL